MVTRRLTVSFIALCALNACDPDPKETDAGSDATTAPDTTATTEVEDEVTPEPCNTVSTEAPEVDMVGVAGSAPTAQGGTIAEGTYFLTEAKLYGSTGTLGAMQQTVVVADGEFQFFVYDTFNDAFTRSTATYTTDGVEITLTETCPDQAEPDVKDFDADEDAFTIYSRSGATSGSITYTKQ